MTNKTVFKFIKTPCGQAKYVELEANKTLLGKFRLLWFILNAAIRDWNIKELILRIFQNILWSILLRNIQLKKLK